MPRRRRMRSSAGSERGSDMGARGQMLSSGGFSKYNYKTLITDGNIRYIMQIDTRVSAKIPAVSNSPDAVYVTLGSDGKIHAITFFNKDREKYLEIDCSHFHEGMKPHVHVIPPGAQNPRSGPTREMTGTEREKYERAVRFYKEHGIEQLYKDEKEKQRAGS